ncbi:hypothetical protein HN371_17935 [Candidatus Poribacteria bacterium]|jgi:hypothetical protein|nr:hypothetical protein [Candidatus Poribacteria bacterium]MBT5531566.1 hypothetical protein [Candidatus Poribacteria bacterium]MBT5710779.1 hypothetical protein [Candidatus Poribacteria bacterium]MBT7099573.1 hypothetical protein [Candidatus Poribacteria bacterium]MBT7808117.1 hypothetical protein [Candidatus Poribacteria bacterium]
MAVRTEMQSLVAHTQRLVSDSGATTWSNTALVQDALDRHATHVDWAPMRHDIDYHMFQTKQRQDRSRTALSAGVRDVSPASFDVPDFGSFYRVGYFDNNWAIRDGASETSASHSPDSVNAINGTFIFSTAVTRELYLKGTAHNVWHAAADLLLETPDSATGREYDGTRRRGQVSRGIKQKWNEYTARGWFLNRRRPGWSRG